MPAVCIISRITIQPALPLMKLEGIWLAGGRDNDKVELDDCVGISKIFVTQNAIFFGTKPSDRV